MTIRHSSTRLVLSLLIPLSLPVVLPGKTLHVGTSQRYQNLSEAATQAEAGDSILIHPGTYSGGEYIEGLQGREDAWITIIASTEGDVIFDGDSEAWHMSDIAYITIEGFEFRGQSGNGLNIDDGGDYTVPSHHVTIRDCYFHDMSESGNHDLVKLSGLDDFTIIECTFKRGADGGSGVDMVGCHRGLFVDNYFESMGSNAIQAKGGTQFVRIEKNRFIDCGQRAVNLGGSTDLEFFRPINAEFEAADLQVYSNIFVGSIAPIAFVGSVRVDVTNNTIWLPERWVVRILQETVDPERFLSCGDNVVRNNIFVINDGLSTEVNIGPDTRPESFTFTNNLWFNIDNSAWGGPTLPVVEPNQIVSQDPLFRNPSSNDFSIPESSPAAGAGMSVTDPERDFVDRNFLEPRSVGAYEVEKTNTTLNEHSSHPLSATLYPNPSNGQSRLILDGVRDTTIRVELYDLYGRKRNEKIVESVGQRQLRLDVDLPQEAGTYILMILTSNETISIPVIYLGGKDE